MDYRRQQASSRAVQAVASSLRQAETVQRQATPAMDDPDRSIQALPTTTIGLEENARDSVVIDPFEMGDDQRRMKVESSATEEASLPWVAAIIDVGLPPRRIWDGLDAAIMMDSLDGSTGRPRWWVSLSSPSFTYAGGVGWQRRARDFLDLAGGSMWRGSDPPIEPDL
ncbi:hypothetical protein ACLOJK_037275 [Asimina triloba]